MISTHGKTQRHTYILGGFSTGLGLYHSSVIILTQKFCATFCLSRLPERITITDMCSLLCVCICSAVPI